MNIRALKQDELLIVHEIAHATWPDTFKDILTQEQIQYMLNWMYNLKHLENQFNQGHQFYIAELEEMPVGFIGIEPNHPEKGLTKIHKIYILPNKQGLGIGKKLIEYVKELSIQSEMEGLLLNVNRYNKAVDFYKAIGFNILFEENIDIGNGYLMEDFVMKLEL
jgi:ribosomal protein S18 acetylase RimI-like enzyme